MLRAGGRAGPPDCRELALGPLALAFVGVSDKDSVAEVRKCESRYGDGWVDEWLQRRGLSLDQYLPQEEEAAQRGSEEEFLKEVAA